MDVLTEAAERGFELEERALRGQWVRGWRRGDDTRFPGYLSEREASSGMADRLRHIAVFEQVVGYRAAHPFGGSIRRTSRVLNEIARPLPPCLRFPGRGVRARIVTTQQLGNLRVAPFAQEGLPSVMVVVPSDPLRDVKRFEATRNALRDAVESEAPLPRRERRLQRRRRWRRRSS